MRIPAAALLAALSLPAALTLPAATAAQAGAATAAAGPATVPYHWQNAQIVAGGFVDGIVFSPAERGLAYARTDIGGAYRWDAAARRWVPLASPANGLWRSTDGGADWSQVASFPVTSTPDDIGLSFVTFGPAGEAGRAAGVSPPSPRIAGDSGGSSPRASTDGQPTKTIFVGDATGKDLYESTDAGATWRLVPGQPTGMMPQHAALASDGTLYLDYANQPGPNGMTDGSVWKYGTGTGTWTDITPEVPGAGGNPSFGYAGLAVDPEHPGTSGVMG